MIVSCPSCDTKFNLPDDKVQPGSQLRCSVCKHVFGVPDARGHMPGQLDDTPPSRHEEAPEQDQDAAFEQHQESVSSARESVAEKKEPLSSSNLNLDAALTTPPKQKKSTSRTGLWVFLFLLLLIGGGAAGVFFFKPDLVQSYLPFLNDAPAVSSQDLVSKITLRGVRQYSINNEKLGVLSVIEGKAVNGFSEPRELIKVEASLYDKDGKVLASKQQVAGTQASLFQLQVLSEKDLEQTLNNKVDILTNNINVPPGGEVPFMIVFYNSPENATEFGVKVTEARLPPK